MAIPAPAALFKSASRSNSNVRSASTERQVAPARIITSTVRTPITGTSNRMSWFGLATLTTVSRRASVEASSLSDCISLPARSIVASVPSMASTATQACAATTTVCPISNPASARATPIPYSTFFRSSSSGARPPGTSRVSSPSLANSGSRNAVELINSIPSSASTFATAPSSISVFRVRRFRSSFEAPVRPDAREDLLVLHLAGHHRRRDALFVEHLDQLRELAQREPVHADMLVRRSAMIDFRLGLFADRGHRHRKSLRPRRIQQQKREPPIARNQTKFHGLLNHASLAPFDKPRHDGRIRP